MSTIEQALNQTNGAGKVRRDIVRFGDGENDYFTAAGTDEDFAALTEILAKVAESPEQLKKMRDMPMSERPGLVISKGERSSYGYCAKTVLSISKITGTGYKAAAVFAHEFQHQCQYVYGNAQRFAHAFSLKESILEERIGEAAAETAAYQYLYDVKDNNPQAQTAYKAALEKRGMRAYALARRKGESEPDCVLAGMQGYADNLRLAERYEKSYHPEIASDIFTDFMRLTNDVRQGRSGFMLTYAEMRLGGNTLDEWDALQTHTVCMAAGFDEQKARAMLRSDNFAYIGEQTAKFLTDGAKVYAELTGERHPFETEKTVVRNKVGTYDLREKDGLAGLYKRAQDLFAKKENTAPLATYFYKNKNGREVFSFDGTKKGGVIFRADSDRVTSAASFLPDSILSERRKTAEKMFVELTADEAMKKRLMNLQKPLVLGFKKGTTAITPTPDGQMIILDPLKSPKKLAKDFTQQLDKLQAREAVLSAQKQAGR
ncbi:MAG TPA: hypothetical protein DD624_06470 [Alphaproteobacteria bacterium]|nr:hypothetical protein [Alphaproteobacteria bacterium]